MNKCNLLVFKEFASGDDHKPGREELGRAHEVSLPVWTVDVVPSREYDEILLIKSVETMVFDIFESQQSSSCVPAFEHTQEK